jgi:hypothetical protein
MTVLVFGGQRKGFDCPRTLPESLETLAGRTSYRINITWDGPGTLGVAASFIALWQHYVAVSCVS